MQLIEVVNEKVATMIYEDNHSVLPRRTRVINELDETIDTLLRQYKYQQNHTTREKRIPS